MEKRQQVFWSMIGISLLCLLHHLVIWKAVAIRYNIDWQSVFVNWDSNWYNRIINYGYYGKNWAFFPLYPLSIYSVLSFDRYFPPQIAGAIFSTSIFLCFSILCAFLVSRSEKNDLLPKNLLSWFFFVYSAASFAFHSHHTESLFLLLSFLAFWNAYEDKWIFAAIFAGFSWLTRHQGAFVSVCVALQCASSFYGREEYKKSVLRFFLCFLISFALFSLYPFYQYLQMGRPTLFLESQSNWSHATGVASIFKTLWFGNPEQQRMSVFTNGIHLIYYSLMWIPVYWLWQRNRILALYGAMSLCVLFLQGSFLNIFRFAVVLFPLHFIVGEKVSTYSTYTKGLAIFFAVALNHYLTMRYSVGQWAY